MYNHSISCLNWGDPLVIFEANTAIQVGHYNSKKMSSDAFRMTAFRKKKNPRVLLNYMVEENLANLKG